jgi:signal transduction histidine kinase/ActR/RegA family two-component response regulator
LILLALAALLPLAALAAGLAGVSLRQQQQAMQAEAVRQVAAILDTVERELHTQVELLKVLAQSPTLDGAAPDLATFHEVAQRFIRERPLWNRVNLADLDGWQIVNTSVPFGAPLPKVVDPDGYRRAIETAAPIVGDLAGPGPLLPDSRPRVSFRVPVVRDGKVRYVLTTTVSPERLSELAATPGLPPAWLPFVVDGSGRIVASPRAPAAIGERTSEEALRARASGSEGVYDGRRLDGTPTKAAFRKSAHTGWSAHLAIPLDLYNAPLTRSLWILAAAGLAALSLTLVFAALMRREVLAGRQEAALRERASRMEALGRMTGGVAHDFNNLLMVILGNLEMLQRRVQAPNLDRYVASIRKAAEKGTHLTRELLSFSRGEAAQAEVFDLNERVRNVLAMLRQSLRGDISVMLDLAPGPLPVRIDPIGLDLAILNVAVNARDAMPEGGVLRISARRAPFPDRSGRRGVALSMADTGGGVPEEALPHVFEPFFTTKEVGKGTGLGLSQVYGFAKASGGLADIESRAGRGTTVTIYLPEAEEGMLRAGTEAAAPREPAPAARVRLLLVDDNDEVRAVAADFLAEEGFEVAEAADAREAIEALERHGADVLVSDIVMPGALDGFGLAQEARRRWPNLPVLLASGYSASAARATELGFTVLAKPFQMTDLADAVRRTASAARPAAVEGPAAEGDAGGRLR